jgi:glycerol-3-phosphate O-acyltransferase/dihydroxyacetone phosphate acyltransferase
VNVLNGVMLPFSMEQLVAAWRVIVGIWTPKARERPMDYLKSFIPESATPVGATPADAVRAWQKGGPPVSVAIKAKLKEKKEKKRLPTRRLIKHVLRSRVKAAQALEAFLTELEGSDTRVNAKPWLAELAAFGGDEDVKLANEVDDNPDILSRIPKGSRAGSEVVQYLRSNGAKITASQAGLDAWAGAQSEFEGVKSDEE